MAEELQGQWFRPDEIARMLNISRRTVYRKVRKGEIKAYKIGKLIRIPRDEIERIIHRKCPLLSPAGHS